MSLPHVRSKHIVSWGTILKTLPLNGKIIWEVDKQFFWLKTAQNTSE
jgi:hypothetical protein